jgi:ABC-type transport system involved in multi-copper enzyme maturation permease subunit
MKTIFRIAQTELRLFFYSPIAWLILIIFAFQAVMAFCDTFSYQLQNKALGRGQIPFQTVILLLGDSGSFFKVLNNLYLYIPLLTMALMSREYSSGSIKLLYSSPVTNFQIIGGKFLAMMLYGGLMLVILLLQVVFAFIISGRLLKNSLLSLFTPKPAPIPLLILLAPLPFLSIFILSLYLLIIQSALAFKNPILTPALKTS